MFGFDRAGYELLIKQLVECVKNLYTAGYTEFISGGTQGFDQIAFWAVDIVKRDPAYSGIKNKVYIPFKGQEGKWFKEGLFSQKEYSLMLSRADEVKVISEEQSIAALFQRNEAMVDASDGILCLYEDDSWKNASNGGTAKAMQYASRHMMDIWQLVFDKNSKGPYPIRAIQKNIFM